MRYRASCTSGSGEDRSVVAVAGLCNTPLASPASLGPGFIKSSRAASSGLATADHLTPSPRFAGFSSIGPVSRTWDPWDGDPWDGDPWDGDLWDGPTHPASHKRPPATRANPMIKPNPAA